MRRLLVIGAGLAALAGCGRSSDAVGENSPGSIKTTAIGNVVAAIPSPTPTPTDDGAMTTTTNVVVPASDNATGAMTANIM